jgi:membrane-associated phospholipid phosphatase
MRTIVSFKDGIFQTLMDNRYFLFPYFIILSVSLVILGLLGNSGAFFYVNRHHAEFVDFWFLRFTNFGDGAIAFLVVFILMWVSMRDALALLVITLLIIILDAVFKKYFFAEFDRPIWFFGRHMIRLVPGYEPPRLNSFPSGHSTTAFSVYLYISLLIRQKVIKFCLFLIALMIGYSRIYLSAHFPADVIFGSLIAVLITITAYYYFKQIKVSWIDRRITIKSFKVLTYKTA